MQKRGLQASVVLQDENCLSVTDIAILEARAAFLRIKHTAAVECQLAFAHEAMGWDKPSFHHVYWSEHTGRAQGNPQIVEMLLEREKQEDEEMEKEADMQQPS